MSLKKQRYLRTEFEWLDSELYRKVMSSCKGISLIYDILRRYVIRDLLDHKVSRHIYDNFYSKNKLASSVTFNKLSDLTGLSLGTINKAFKTLEAAKFIEIRETTSNAGEKQNVFVLGRRKPYFDKSGMPTVYDWWLVDDVISSEELKDIQEDRL